VATLTVFAKPPASVSAAASRTLRARQPGLLAFDAEGRLITGLSLDIAGDAIQTIRSVINPDKPAHLGNPLSDLARAAQ
jgi:hypothetical protein